MTDSPSRLESLVDPAKPLVNSAEPRVGPAKPLVDPANPSIEPGEPQLSRGSTGSVTPHSFLFYTLARTALLVTVGSVCYLAGARGILLITLAFIGSGLLSFVLLDRLREGMSIGVAGFFGRLNDKIEKSRRAEDGIDVVDQLRGDDVATFK